MSAIALYDGSAGATRALEFAGLPGNLLPSHDGFQLVLVHAWDPERQGGAGTGGDGGPAPPAGAAPPSEGVPAPVAVRAPVGQLISSALSTIQENKYLKDSLHYKIETSALPLAPKAKAPESATVSPSKKGGKGKANAAVPPPTEAVKTEEELLAEREKEEGARAAAVVAYAAARAAHHKATVLVLGAGNTMEGKTIIVGRVARATLERQQQDASRLIYFYMKADGLVMRPTTARLRHLVVLAVGATEREAEGGAAVAEELAHTDGAVAAATRALHYALRRCRPQFENDSAAVLLVVGPSEAAAAAAAALAPTLETIVLEHRRRRSEHFAAAREEARAGAEEAAATPPPQGAEAAEDANEEEEGAAAPPAVLPPVTVCPLKASKKIATPTLENSMPQVTKAMQSLGKVDFVVTSAAAPDTLKLALLGLAKPHCIIVP